MIRLFKTLAAHIWILTLLLIILGAVFITLARLTTPVISDYRPEMARWASETLGYPVTIGKIFARWSGLGPQLVLKDVSLINPQSNKPALDISQVQIGINLADSLRSWTLSPHRITVIGAKLLIRRHLDGSIVIGNLETLGSGVTDTSGAFLLPNRVTLKQCEVYWKSEAIAGKPIHFSNVEVDLNNEGSRHQLNGRLTLPPTSDQDSGGSFRLAALLQIKEGNLDNLSGEIYAKGNSLPLVRLVKGHLPKQFRLTGGLGDMELWSQWEQGMPTQLEGHLRLSGLRVNSISENPQDPGKALESDLVDGRFRWQQTVHGWRFDLKDLLFSRRGLNWPESELSLMTHTDAEGHRQIRAGAGFLRLEDIHAIVDLLPDITPELQQALRKIRPQADIHQLKLIYQEEDDDQVRWAASGKVDPLFTRAWKKLPALNNLGFRFWLDQDHGSMLLESQQAGIDFPRLFRNPLPLDRLQGVLTWKRRELDGWRIDSDALLAENSDIQTISRIVLELPKVEGTSIFMDLETDFVNGDGSATPRYLPVGIMNPNLLNWLDRAIVQGEITSGRCSLYGPLKAFPFHKSQSGRFDVRFKARDITLDYGPGWPRAENITADVRFLNNSFELKASEGRIFNTRIRQAHAAIESLRPTSPLLISLQSEGPVNDQLRFLAQSPLKTKFAPLVTNLRGTGDASLALDLTLPLKKQQGQITLDGRASLNGAGLDLLAWKLPIRDIRGDLLFDQAHLHAKGIKGQILGSKGTVDISTPAENDQITRLSASGTVASKALSKQFPQSGLEYFQGTTGWQMQLDIPHTSAGQAATVPLKISSNLVGIGIDLPVPLGKEPGNARNLLINTDLRGGDQAPLQIRYGKILDASILLAPEDSDRGQLVGANLQLGGGRAKPAKADRLEVRGHLQQLQLSDWLGQTKKRQTGSSLPPLEIVDLGADLILLGKRRLTNNHLTLRRSPQAWTGQLSSDSFAGNIRIPKDLQQKRIDINLQRLDLTYEHRPEADSALTEPAESTLINPGDIPSLQLAAEQLKINDHLFGAVQIVTRRKPHSLQLERFSLDSDRLQLSAIGSWSKNEGLEKTQLDLKLKSSSLGGVISDLGIWSNMEQAPADIDSQLHWNSAPHSFRLEDLNGYVSLRLGKGQLLEIKPGMGRLLGLLNIGSLQRRLKLDFNDMTRKGFAFDKIEGDFEFKQGNAQTDNLSIEGPAANIDVSGSFGLRTKEFDQEITVTPSISSPLSLTGFAAGPQVGVALILAQRLVGKEIDKASRSRYTVTGPWNELKVVNKADADTIDDTDIPQLGPLDQSMDNNRGNWRIPLSGD